MLEGRTETAPASGSAVGVRIPALEPHAALAGGAVAMVLAEVAAQKQGSAVWIVLGAVASAFAFLVAWRSQERLRLVPLLVVTLGFNVAWIAVDLALGVTSVDSAVLYRIWGNSLLHGHYPDAQYPPAAVLLFAFDALVGGGPTRIAHAFVMVPFQLVTVAAVWALRTGRSAWLAALVALWPLNAFSWEFRFDLVPTALLALGLLFALRERWVVAGALLGLGAAAKWTPALACALLVVWLASGRRWRPAAGHAVAFAAVFAAAPPAVPRLEPGPHRLRVPVLPRPGRDRRVDLVPPARADRPRERLAAAVLASRARSRLGQSVHDGGAGCRAARARRCRVACASERARCHRCRRDGAGALPAPEPRLQPAVPRAHGRGMGDRGRAVARATAGSSSCSVSG